MCQGRDERRGRGGGRGAGGTGEESGWEEGRARLSALERGASGARLGPPWMQKIFSSTIAAKGRQLKTSQKTRHNLML